MFVLCAAPFLFCGYGAFELGDWRFGIATIVLSGINVLAALPRLRFSDFTRTLLIICNVLVAASVSYGYYTAEKKVLLWVWALITVGYMVTLVIYRSRSSRTASLTSGESKSQDAHPAA